MEQQLNLEEIKPIESSSEEIDLWKHDKTTQQIDSAKVMQVKSNYSKNGKQWVLRVESQPVEVYQGADSSVEFRASELFNLIQDEEGNLQGFPIGDRSNLFKFCQDIGFNIKEMENLGQLVENLHGKKAMLKAYDKEVDGNKKTYLTFRYR